MPLSLQTQSPSLNRWQRLLAIVILLLALVSRLVMLDTRAMSHDESIHTKFSWNLYAGEGFQHNPMMHGPLLFEVTALSYHIFGTTDFASRLVPALLGVALVMTPLLFRRWLRPAGAFAASVLLLISPSISYYSRYIRHDVFLMLSAVLLLWIMLRYLQTGASRWLYWMAACFSVMYATKEASYFYTAIFGVLFFLPFALQVLTIRWDRRDLRSLFFALLVGAIVLGAVFVVSMAMGQMQEMALDDAGNAQVATLTVPVWGRMAAGFAILLLGTALVVMVPGIGARAVAGWRLFDLLMALGTLTLPLGSAFLIKFVAGVDMNLVYEAVRTGDFASVPGPTVVALAAVTAATLMVSAGFGLWWDRKRWWRIAFIHYTIFFVLYTTIFTWGFGAVSGLIGGLAYWLAQQGVKRGNQPSYYYLLLGSLYEYLPVVLSVLGGGAAVVRALKVRPKRAADAQQDALPALNLDQFFPLFLAGWTLISWGAYTYAGEKMPWLMVHIVLPSIFLGGWWLGQLVELIHWERLRTLAGGVFLAAAPVLAASVAVLVVGAAQVSTVLTAGIPTAGPRLAQLRPLGMAAGGLILVLAAGWCVVWSARRLTHPLWTRGLLLLCILFLTGLTIRTSTMLNYENYDLATELMVYAHGTPDVKVALRKIEEISWRVTESPRDVKVAYGEDGSWPFTWYMVNFPNNYFYSTSPDEEQLLDCPVVIAGTPQYGVVEEILGDDYIAYDYVYLWWPLQDYFGLTWARVRDVLENAEMRDAIWDIAWHRDYRQYAALKNPEDPFDLATWPYRKDFRLYVQRDLAAETWPLIENRGGPGYAEPVATEPPDPYSAGERQLTQVAEISLPGAVVRGVAQAPDGTFYVADTINHRIWHVGTSGVIEAFGEYGAQPGQFSEPWDVAVDGAGHIYVADTWNHRIQKLDGEGQVVAMWGSLGQVAEIGAPGGEGVFYGPRGLALGPDQELFVTDTGNKRVQVFDLNGKFLREFGGGGRGVGQLDEPVGIAVGPEGRVAVADTWNRRVQIYTSQGVALREWQIPNWDVTNPDEKPYLTWDDGRIFVTAPLRGRVLAFDEQGMFNWALNGSVEGRLQFPVDVSVANGVLYVTDAHSGALLGYELP